MIEIKEFKIVNDHWLRVHVSINQDCQHTTSGTYDGVYIKNISIVTKGNFYNSTFTINDDITVNKLLWDTLNASFTYTGKFTPAAKADLKNYGITFTVTNIIDFNIDIDLDGCSCLNNKIFYLKVIADKPIGSTVCSTCAYIDYAKEVYVDKSSMYKKIACVAHKIEDCNIPHSLVDYLMRLKALEAAINVYKEDTNDTYSNDVNKYYEELILTPKTNVKFKTCNCNR